MATGKANTANVSTTRGVKGGYAFSAPAGTVVPTDIKTPLSDDFVCMGFISEDGFTEGVDGSSENINDMNGDVCDTYDEAMTETIALTLIEMSEEALAMQYGHKNVTTGDGLLVVDHNWGQAGENRAVVLELVLKNDRRWRKVIPSGKVSERGEFTGNSTSVAGREVTITYQTDETGSGCKDYIETVEASEPSAQSDSPARAAAKTTASTKE